MKTRLRNSIPLISIAYMSYILLGIPNGLLGVAWPSIRQSFGVPLDTLGTLLMATTAGYILASFNSGRIISRAGFGLLLLISSVVTGMSLLGYALAPTWWIVVLLGLLGGMGTGLVDTGLNTYVAANYSARQMNWLHACFGLGVTAGPAIMTTILNLGQSWRWGYGIVVIMQGLLAACFGLTLDQWQDTKTTSAEVNPNSSTHKARGADTLRLPMAWLGMALYIVHPGIQFTVGQWAYSLFTAARSVNPSTAGLWVSIYWGSLTVGRLVLGSVADRLGVDRLLRICTLGILLGSLLLWWNIANVLDFLALALIGFALAPLFPSLISRTPERVGLAHAANAIGYQVAAANIGIALVPGFVGVLAEGLGLEIVGPFLVVASVVLISLHEVTVRLDRWSLA